MSYIASYCKITSENCWVNGVKYKLENKDDSNSLLKNLYNSLDISYPKFYKMDDLSKISFLGSELLIQVYPEIKNYNDNEIALLFSNNNSSAVTDQKYKETYDDGVPSPALFVYTLPNILIGEIAIRNKWYGENMFTISKKFDANYFNNYCNILLNKNVEAALCGWINTTKKKNGSFLIFSYKKRFKTIKFTIKFNSIIRVVQFKQNEIIMEDLKAKLKVQIIEQLNLEDINPSNIDDDTQLFGDGLGLDSIDALELIVLLENNYGIKLINPEEGREVFESVNSLAKFITAQTK